jgi:PAS domain-containing protein
VGRIHWEAFPASVGAEPERQYRRVQAERVEAHFVHHYVGEGYDFHLEIAAYPVGEGGVAVFWRDVSERVRTAAAIEAARADAEARAATLAAVIDSIPDAVLVGQQGAITLANQAALAQLGVPSVEALRAAAPAASTASLPLEDVLLDPETGAPVPLAATPIGRALVGERSHAHFLLRALGTAGAAGAPGPRPVRVAAAPIVGPGGTVIGTVAVLADMTRQQAAAAERERLLAELSSERTLLRTVLDQMPAAVFIVEAPSGRVLALNDAVARVWGEPRPLTDAVGHYSEEWVGYHLDGRRIASDEWPVARAALAGETVTDWVGEIERPDGARVTIEVSAAPVRDARAGRWPRWRSRRTSRPVRRPRASGSASSTPSKSSAPASRTSSGRRPPSWPCCAVPPTCSSWSTARTRSSSAGAPWWASRSWRGCPSSATRGSSSCSTASSRAGSRSSGARCRSRSPAPRARRSSRGSWTSSTCRSWTPTAHAPA